MLKNDIGVLIDGARKSETKVGHLKKLTISLVYITPNVCTWRLAQIFIFASPLRLYLRTNYVKSYNTERNAFS